MVGGGGIDIRAGLDTISGTADSLAGAGGGAALSPDELG